MSELSTIRDLLEEEIKDLYSAEKQLTKAIPKMAKGLDQ
jgi:ferritin-like metal-binding protein YciE